jgi:LPXTG-motif cell wall-anchored protein
MNRAFGPDCPLDGANTVRGRVASPRTSKPATLTNGPTMRTRLLGALAAGSMILLPAGALAQEDPCYVDPTSPECIDVGSDDAEVDDGEVSTDDGTEVDAEVVARTSTTGGTSTGVLARTGLETGTLVALFVGLLAGGGALLVATRRRSTS